MQVGERPFVAFMADVKEKILLRASALYRNGTIKVRQLTLQESQQGRPLTKVNGLPCQNVFDLAAGFGTAVSHILHPNPQRK